VAQVTVRARIAASRLARPAALPGRATAAAKHVATETALVSKWLFRSKEHHNFTYNLTNRNLRHLAWWVSAVTGAPAEDCSFWIEEVLNDKELRDHVRTAVERSDRRGLADIEVRIGRRAGWYATIRALKPDHVVETGTDKGLGSLVLASAILRNGHGRLTTLDVNPAAGYLISDRYAEVTSLSIGDSVPTLRAMSQDVGVFVQDSDHSADHEKREFTAVEPALVIGARVLSDNSHSTDSLLEWAEATGRRFLYFRETPDRHWYPGEGIGASW
jgi:hypothetical protein